ncbi:TaqI-like C-terminal specificity domain-containing protein [Natrinema sp. 1APR25-10V2]|uniref:Eco57I restriction-modification methylase domain-containing protein n=1 Tax=Natrinema sp. 1APR25-10V2 TaxID=2951081 RepID=UPI0028769F39|nr:TaqI-like C-terminal specificity domain-containing protein [Natrinema sp. 1APR25-10V2]MDS0473780.1 Eco57I restriction-modification methylase domain-containing protein [Natrinema sp. 1APR25-10V2]
MQTALTYRTNRDLFSNHYLDEHLPETEEWDQVSDEELQEAYEDIKDLWEREKSTAPKRNESQLEEKFIRPMFRKLGIPFEVEESTSRTQRRPDYGFFETEDAARKAFERREEGGDFYKDSVAVADAKRWGRPLDTRGSGEHERDFENPSYQIHVYLQETPARWAVLTDGKKWRLYYAPTSHRLDSYYEIDLPTVLEKGDLEDFKYFYLFFRHEAFLEDTGGDSFLDDVYDESNVFAQELGEDLQDNIYEAIKILSEGFLQYPDNDLDEDDLDLIHDSSLIYLYRLIFVLYAESEGRDLLNTNNEIYEQSYSLNSLKQEIAEELDSADPKYRDWQDNLQSRLDELFTLIDKGSKSRGIPEEDLYIPAYNGGLFRTDPDEDDSREAKFLANHDVGDAYLAKVIDLLTRSENANGGGKIFVDYSSLDVRHLGSIYEGLLEYQLNIAEEPLALDDGEYVSANEGDDVVVQEGEVYLTTGSGERKATGSYYTPEYVVEYIVENTLEPLVDDIREELAGQNARGDRGFAAEFAERVFDLKILDPAMGSGHFLTSAIDYLAREIIDAQEKQAAQQGIETVDEEHDINWARRQVAQRCIYGVDLNPLAVELAKVSLWLRTLAAEQPLAFLDHHLKTGNSLVGSDIEEIEELESDSGGDGQNASLADFGVARKGTIEQLMRIYEDFIAIENQELADVKEMESKYDEFERNKLRQRLEAMANVHTAEDFGLDNLPSDAYERMAAALEDDDEWEEIEQMQWFQDAQKWADDDNYFHWKLEFPEVYYQEDGQSANVPGFDAVIGNPPYVRQELITQLKDYLQKEFDVYHGRADIYAYFVEQAIELAGENRRLSYILSHKFTKVKSGKGLRNLVGGYQIEEFIDFQDLPVFGPDVSAYPAIMVLSTSSPTDDFKYAKIDDLGFSSLPERVEEVKKDVDQSDLSKDEWTFLGKEERELKNRISDIGRPVVEAIGDPLVGVKSGLNEVLIIDEEKLTDLFGETEDTELFRPIIFGKEIKRFRSPKPESYIMYPYERTDNGVEVANLEDYEVTKQYLEQHKEDLVSRAIIEDKYPKGEMEWYELQQVNKNVDPSKEKIVYPDISRRAHYTIDTSGSVVTTTGFILQSSDRYYLGLLNSALLEWILAVECAKARGGYLRPKAQYVGNLPIKEVDPSERVYGSDGNSEGELAGRIEKLSQELLDLNDERRNLNLNLLDYLSGYEDGETLGDIYFPPEDVSDSILTDTEDERDSLRVGSIELKEDGDNLVLYSSARYKPTEPENFETDQWGYTETDLMPAMKFTNLSDIEMVLLKEFIPLAVDEAGGFAGFRETATSTNSLIDRFTSLTLPEIESCRNGLERFADVKERVDEIDSRIQEAENEIDDLVFELYGLSSAERELVENALSNLIEE